MADNGATPAKCLNDLDGGGFVEVMFAKSQHEASDLCQLLTGRNIPVRLESSPEAVAQFGIAVLVPPDHLVAASELLAGFDQDEEEEEFDDDDEDDEFEDDDDIDDDDIEDDFEDEDEEYEDLEEDEEL